MFKTITISISAAGDAIFSFLPVYFYHYKFALEIVFILILILILLNLRGVKESIKVLAPIFIVFLITHVFVILYVIFHNMGQIPATTHAIQQTNFTSDYKTLGGLALFLIVIKAYSFGSGTYTGIEAVSNSLSILRTPKIGSAKKPCFTLVFLYLLWPLD